MSKEIKITRIETNLKQYDSLINIFTKDEYRVIYIDLVEAKAVIENLSLSKDDSVSVLELKEDCSHLQILT